jgi:hypothetical protein
VSQVLPQLLVWLGVGGLLLLPLVISIRRATELFVVQVRRGEARFARGRIPPGLLNDIAEIARSEQIGRARLSALRRRGRAVLVVGGKVGEAARQRLRNAVGLYSLQKIAAGTAYQWTPRRRTPRRRG